MAIFRLPIWNAWLLSVPFVALGFLFMAMKKDIAKRMSDMTGYNRKEKFFTVVASLAPYPFMIGTIWTPFTSKSLFLLIGLLFYIIGMVLFAETLRTIIRTPHDERFSAGPYRYTRNPLYVAATTASGAYISLAASTLLLLQADAIFSKRAWSA